MLGGLKTHKAPSTKPRVSSALRKCQFFPALLIYKPHPPGLIEDTLLLDRAWADGRDTMQLVGNQGWTQIFKEPDLIYQKWVYVVYLSPSGWAWPLPSWIRLQSSCNHIHKSLTRKSLFTFPQGGSGEDPESLGSSDLQGHRAQELTGHHENWPGPFPSLPEVKNVESLFSWHWDNSLETWKASCLLVCICKSWGWPNNRYALPYAF